MQKILSIKEALFYHLEKIYIVCEIKLFYMASLILVNKKYTFLEISLFWYALFICKAMIGTPECNYRN